MKPVYLSLTQVHLEREDQPQAKPLEEINVRLNIVDNLLVVEGLDLHPAGDPVVNLVVGKNNPQLELSLLSTYPVHDFFLPLFKLVRYSLILLTLFSIIADDLLGRDFSLFSWPNHIAHILPPYLFDWINVIGDGYCGFRAIAVTKLGGEEAWPLLSRAM